MRAIVQRVNGADILIDGEIHREIKDGLVVFLGVMGTDTKANAEYLANKITGLRIFKDENDKLNLSLEDLKGDILIVSNFTLSADCKLGKRPSFERAAKGDLAKELYEYFVSLIRNNEKIGSVQTGEFGAHMHVNVQNDGPINIIMDTDVIVKH